MSAIAGIYHPNDRPVDPIDLELITKPLVYRGPDGGGAWHSAGVGLIHLAFRTIDEDWKIQLPWSNPERSLSITADARLDNRAELINALRLEKTDRSIPDSRLLLKVYRKWGPDGFEKLVGDFTCAIWDEGRQQLVCARDPMGVKPFFYHHNSKLFVFASEISAILKHPEVPRRLNEVRIADYLAHNFEDQKATFYQDIFRLPPGHFLIVNREGLQVRDYWTPDLSQQIRYSSDDEYAMAFKDVFEQAVRASLRGPDPLGAMLSGGLDSSSIACIAREALSAELRPPLHTFSAIFPNISEIDPRIDERDYIDQILLPGSFVPHQVRADKGAPLAEFLWEGAEPIPAPNIYMDQAIVEAAKQAGMRILLSGFDGDSTISYGFEHLPYLLLVGRWSTFLREINCLSNRFEVPRRQVFWRLGLKPLIPVSALQIWRSVRNLQGRDWQAKLIVEPRFARQIGLEERLRSLSPNGSALTSTPAEHHWHSLRSGLLSYAVGLLDLIGSRMGVELRYPFFNRRLIEFSLMLPSEQKLKNGWTRFVLRNAMGGILPEGIRWRLDKSNMSANFKLKIWEEFEDISLNEFMEANRVLEDYIDMEVLSQVYRRFTANRLGRETDVLTVFTTIILSRWLQATGLKC